MPVGPYGVSMPARSSEGAPLDEGIRESALLYLAHGPRCWPGAASFTLLEVDAFGSSTGEAQSICRACVREAAQRVLARIAELSATDSCRLGLPYLDLVGEFAAAEGICSICGDGL